MIVLIRCSQSAFNRFIGPNGLELRVSTHYREKPLFIEYTRYRIDRKKRKEARRSKESFGEKIYV